MPKIQYYDDVKIIKKPFKKRFLRFLSFFCIVGVFSLCVVFANYMSGALTVSGGVSGFVYGDTSITKKEKNYFAVILGEYDTYDEGKNVAMGSTIQGASGYVWEDEKFSVVGSVYFSEEDAKTVLNNLSESNYKVSIKKITINKIDINFSDYDNKTVRKIENALDYLNKVIKDVYSYSIDFDKGLVNNLAVSTNLSDLRGDCKVLISEMQSYLNTPNENLQIIQNTLIKVDQLLNEVILKTIDNTATGYILKNTVASVVRYEYDLYGLLK